MMLQCRLCGYRADTHRMFVVKANEAAKGTCPKCNQTGNEMFPAMCMLLSPDINKIEENPLLKAMKNRGTTED